MKRYLHIAFLLFSADTFAQQLPYFTQNKAMNILLNPAFTGTRRLVDLRMDYRRQWSGFDGAPITQTLALNSRFYNGMMGAGFYMMKDQTGPTQRNIYNFSYAFHARFPDLELSLGASGSLIKYTVDGSKITIHNRQDPAIDQAVSSYDKFGDGSAGAVLYNDRFHFGVSALNLIQGSANVFTKDTTHKTNITMVPHYYFSTGYNWSGNKDYIWENTLTASYVSGAPFLLDYSLRLFIKEKMFFGTSLRLGDAIALHAGAMVNDVVQIGYSYDIVISPLSKYQSGTHEITIIYSSNLEKYLGRKHGDKGFLRQKFQYLF